MTFLEKWNASQPGWRHFNLKFVFKYDRNTGVKIPRKQGVLAPWVIIHLLYHSSHILRTNLRVSWYISTQNSSRMQKCSTKINKTKWSCRHSFRITREHEENGISLNSWDKAHALLKQMNWLDPLYKGPLPVKVDLSLSQNRHNKLSIGLLTFMP